MWLLFLACVRPGLVPLDPGAPPRLPSPQSEVYVSVRALSPDPVVVRAFSEPLDEALSGAAAAIALAMAAHSTLPQGELRWRAILSGYPWPLVTATVATVPTEQVPAELVTAAKGFSATSDVGLVRSRDGELDRWVLLVGQPTGRFPSFARELAPGARVGLAGFSFRLSQPDGSVVTGEGTVQFSAVGEYLLELSQAGSVATAVPVYVGQKTPQGAPFAGAASAENAGDLDEEVLVRLDALDLWYKRKPAERDPMLDTIARSRLRQWLAGQPLAPAAQHLAAAGYLDGVGGACRAATVADCLDAMWWSVDDRAPLSAPVELLGWAAMPAAGGVAVVVAAQRGP